MTKNRKSDYQTDTFDICLLFIYLTDFAACLQFDDYMIKVNIGI